MNEPDGSWYIKTDNGEEGPVSGTELVARYSDTRVGNDTQVRRKASQRWQSLGSLSDAILMSPEQPAHTLERPPVHPWRRFFARFVDLCLFVPLLGGTIGIALNAAAPQLREPVLLLFTHPLTFGIAIFLCWIPLEGWCLAHYTATPGKALFGIQVRDASGGRLPLGTAIKRTVLMWGVGMALCIPILTLIAQSVAYFSLNKQRSTYWDRATGAQLEYRWSSSRAGLCNAILVGLLGLLFSFGV